ncbi:ribosome-binding factor A [Clostridia bacterium]|nr:ribosome-binding factor A [Clostridia bacterium]
MRKSYRQGRMGEEIKRIVSEMLIRDLKDPGLSKMMGITDVEVSGDGSYATIYISVMGQLSATAASDEEKREVLAAFQRAKGILRKEIGTRLKIKHTPELNFKVDTSGEYGRHMEELFVSLSGGNRENTELEGVTDQ